MEIGELQHIINSETGVVIYFKNNKCAPCMALRPKVEELVNMNFPKMKFVMVDTISNPKLTSAFNVFANPTILVFFEGKEYIRKSKFIGMSELDQEMERIYKMVF
ncbi:MAG: thioredoxin family protein [Salibacteraceae bacterium]